MRDLSVILCERGKSVGRETAVLPSYQEILNHLMVCFDKLNNEATRIVILIDSKLLEGRDKQEAGGS